MIEKNSLVHLECWPLWAVYDKLISILSVIGHRVIFLDQGKGQDVCYYLGVIPHMIIISREITNIVGVCHSCITMDTWIFSITISPCYITGGVSFLLFLHLWYWGMGVVNQDVRVLVL